VVSGIEHARADAHKVTCARGERQDRTPASRTSLQNSTEAARPVL